MSFYPRKASVNSQIAGDGPKGARSRQRFVVHYKKAPANAAANAVMAAVTQLATTQTITTGLTSPAVARALVVVGGAVGQTGNVVVTGTDLGGNVISETFALNGTTPVTGSKAFATVTSVALPVRNNVGDTTTVGTRNVFGLPHILDEEELVILKLFNGAADAGTVTKSATLANNTYTPAGTPNGTASLELVYFA